MEPTNRPPAPNPGDPARMLAVFGLLAFAFVLYAPSLGNDFVWDDAAAATASGGGVRNPLVARIGSLDDYLLGNWWPQRNPGCHTYRPLTTFTFALRQAVCGDSAQAAHMINVLLHVLATGLCLRLLQRLGAGPRAALLGAGAFAAHAVHSETVTNIVGAAELLAFCFGAGGCLLLCGLAPGRTRQAAVRLVAAAMLFTFAYFSKESALAWVGFAPMCAAVAWRARGESRSGRRGQWAAIAAALVLPAVVFLLLRARMIAHLPTTELVLSHIDNPLLGAAPTTRVCTAVLVWGYGLLLTLLPLHLQADYGTAQFPIVTGFGDPWIVATLASGAVLSAAAVLVVFGARRRPLVALAAAAFLGFSFIVSNVGVPTFMLFAERVYFTPTLAVALLVAWVVDRTRALPRGAPVALLCIGAWIGASTLVAWQRNWFWSDDGTIVRRGVVESPNSVRMRLCAGAQLAKDGELVGAQRQFEAAVRLDPRAPQPWLELARLALRSGDRDGAVAALARARDGHPVDVRLFDDELRKLEARCAVATPK